jgi:hypothetical protein
MFPGAALAGGTEIKADAVGIVTSALIEAAAYWYDSDSGLNFDIACR